jgi:glycine hydroxymethyltransferase
MVEMIYLHTSTGQPTDKVYDYEERVNFSVFPSIQGGPHINTIAAIAVALREASTPEFKVFFFTLHINIT